MTNAGDIFGINFLKGLVETGHAILAEIFRLADCIPNDFKDPSRSRFKPFLVDFVYFEDLSVIDRFIDSTENGAQLEDEYLFTFEKDIKRFGALFDAIAHFLADFIEYADDKRSGNVLSMRRTAAFLVLCQYEAEALYIVGVILLALEEKFTSEVKQRLFVAHYRSNPSSNERFDLVVDIFKTARNREELFRRIPLNKTFINNVVLVLHTDVLFADEDEFAICELYPRGIRASRYQRAFLSVCLFFVPSLLHSDYIVMRHIIDTFFTDEWVVHLHMGMVMNVIDAWDRYKAASNALQNVINAQAVKQISANHICALKATTYPFVTKFSIFDVISFADSVTVSNKHLEWLMLHSYRPSTLKYCKRAAQLYDIVNNQLLSCSLDLFKKLLEFSVFEYGYKEIIHSLLDCKDMDVLKMKEELCQNIIQMAELFRSELPLQRIKRNDKLSSWLLLLKKNIEELEVSSPDVLSIISDFKNRLEQVSDMHDLSGIVAVSQYLQSIQALLTKFSHYCMLDEAFLKKVELATNFSYGWAIIDQSLIIKRMSNCRWAENMENMVKIDPLPIRSLFVKLAESIKLTLERLETPERVSSISMCYSRLIEIKLRKILQAVPRSLFALLDKVVYLLNPPQKCFINKTDVRQFADSDRRQQLAATTHAISMLSSGISTMQLTTLGSLRVDPSSLLLDGIRKELVDRICTTLHSQSASDLLLIDFLMNLKNQFAHLRGAFIYMCEHIALNGAVIWHNELARVIGYMLEKECNAFLRHPISEDESLYQSKSAPIPNIPSLDGSLTPLHCLYIRIMNASDPKQETLSCYFVNSMRIWCDLKNKKTVLSKESLNTVQEALSPLALHALDRIASFYIVKYLCELCQYLSQMICPTISSLLDDIVKAETVVVSARLKVFDNALAKFLPNSSRLIGIVSKACFTFIKSNFSFKLILKKFGVKRCYSDNSFLNTKFITQNPSLNVVISLFQIGQLLLLRQQILGVNQLTLRQRSSNVFNAVATLNELLIFARKNLMLKVIASYLSVINDIRKHRGECDTNFLNELTALLERCAITDPFLKIYIRRETPRMLVPIIFLILLNAISKFNGTTPDINSCLVFLKKTDWTDASAFCVGLTCILTQFDVTHEFFALCGIYTSTISLTTRGSIKQSMFVSTLRFIIQSSSKLTNVRHHSYFLEHKIFNVFAHTIYLISF
ncbi:unnamed protein product [Thelazia callipaeda]|uniref:WASH complex subunit strumpellin n=1 Tax=Thelazia callipaeda TaxID=103827 RepID=A0A0N5CWK6_THECL|nr:unnamed protein product [Thelazia callipaeda]